MRISPPGSDPLSSGKCFDKLLWGSGQPGLGLGDAGGVALYEIKKSDCSVLEKEGKREGERKKGRLRSRERRLHVNGTFKEAWGRKETHA